MNIIYPFFQSSQKYFFCICIAAFFLLPPTVTVGESISGIKITLMGKIETANEDMRLSDLAVVEGAPKEMVDRIKAVFIGKAPLPGQSRNLDRQYLVLRLKQNDIDPNHFRFDGSMETEVTRGYARITKEDIEKLVATELYDVLGLNRDMTALKDIQAAGDVILPKGKYTYSIVPPKNQKSLGKTLVSVEFVVGDGFQKRVYVSVDIEQFVDVVVVRYPLRRNHQLSETDIELKRMNLGDLPSNCITDIKEVVGNKLKRNVDLHAVLRTDMIDIPPLINRKDVVLMVAESDNFKIVTLGESKENGYQGDLIKVKNLESNNEVYARVIDSTSVKVEF